MKKIQIISIPTADVWDIVQHYQDIKDIQALEALTRIFIDTPIGDEIGQIWLEIKDQKGVKP